ncbi:hypothetical protein SteCoe_8799 [Stentor coeruleus]|uniref:Uncharacterized protein n=1 Tax=Stentor coeruleus TaxID=5963 RepID=A0A1R2CJ74_9CILI|nr:hypothetical protein SteCoe_8799 [Stentor coeruleus]
MSRRKIYNFPDMPIIIDKELTLKKNQVELSNARNSQDSLCVDDCKKYSRWKTRKIIPREKEKTSAPGFEDDKKNSLERCLKEDRFWAQKELEKLRARNRKNTKSACSCVIL